MVSQPVKVRINLAMTTSGTSTELRFEPPGPGSWEQDPVHFPRPMTRYFQETHPTPCKKGTNDFARFYGLLIDGIQYGYVNGFGYNQVLPAPEAESPSAFNALNKCSRKSSGESSFATGTRIVSRPPLLPTGSCRPLIQTPCPIRSW